MKLSLIDLFLERDLDYLCAVCTPPYHSWKNPVERIMSILNIALQSVGLMRGATHSFEEKFKNSNNLSAIRDLGHKNPGLRKEVAVAMESTKSLLSGLFMRLKLKDCSFATFSAASQEDITNLWENIHKIDDSFKSN